MSLSFPLAMPTDVIGISEIELRAENTVGLTQSPFTYRQQVFRYPGQRWTASIAIAPVNREFGEPWVAFLLALNGQAGTFLLGDPLGACPRGSVADSAVWFLSSGSWDLNGEWLDDISWEDGSTVAVNGNQTAGAEFIAVKGLAISATGVFLAGDYLQLGSGATATLHKVLLDVNSDSSGKANIYVWPRPRRALLNNEIIVYLNARGRFRLAGNQQAWTIANNLRYGVSFEAVEAV
jgi:hypothetical protein